MTTEIPCVAGPAELWFSDLPADVDRARSMCAGCPLRRSCLRGALDRAESCGVWGGELFLAGHPVPSPRRNGRPPRDAAVVDARLTEQMRVRIDAVLAGV